MKILGIETSCDETAAGVVEDGHRLLSDVVASSADLQLQYGGVVPEIAARSHIEAILPVINQALYEALDSRRSKVFKSKGSPTNPFQLSTFNFQTSSHLWDEIDGIAVTYGAGLGGSLLIGVMTARTLALALNKPLYAINHVEAHVYANFLTDLGFAFRHPEFISGTRSDVNGMLKPVQHDEKTYTLPKSQPDFPMLAIIVSGGHSQLVLFRDHFDYTLLGQTHDDAIGEAFDKVAKMLGLPYPGGPSVAKLAKSGDSMKYQFPKAKLNSLGQGILDLRSQISNTYTSKLYDPRSKISKVSYDFSFSGLKTAVLRQAQAEIGESYDFPSTKLSERLSEAQKRDIAASFQRVAIETIVDKARLACDEFQPKSVVIAGGVAANQELRRQLTAALPLPIEFPDPTLCTDNGAMVATLGCFKAMRGQPRADPYRLAIQPNLSM